MKLGEDENANLKAEWTGTTDVSNESAKADVVDSIAGEGKVMKKHWDSFPIA